MDPDDMTGLDTAIARYLMKPSSKAALRVAREARMVEIGSGSDVVMELARANRNDCIALHDAALTLESDPEIVQRNLVARVISGIFPVLNAFEEFRSFEDRTIWDMVLNSFGILSEISTATQYLEATKLSSNAHAERALVKVEERLVEMAVRTGEDVSEKVIRVEEFLDDVRDLNMSPREKPFIPFILWTLVMVLSYKQLKGSV